MPKQMGLYLTDEQRARLEKLAEIAERSMNSVITRLVDKAWTEHQEKELIENAIDAGAQNPEPGTAPRGQEAQ